jgi:2,3-bisphosphoglycerate-dependent phosphoglycerate mutase
MSKRLAGLVLIALCHGFSQPAEFTTTIILMRHAEKDTSAGNASMSMSANPPLSEAGHARTRSLANILREVPIDAIYTTQYIRTRETVQQITRDRNIELNIIPVQQDVSSHANDVVRAILTSNIGQTVLVVGHSNTIPVIISALGIAESVSIDDDEYDDLFIVTRGNDGTSKLLRLKYCR